ncbi:MAG: ribonuclease III [Opitutales bacterium]
MKGDPDQDSDSLETLQQRLQYQFDDIDLLVRALTHSSYAIEIGDSDRHNQRLEFLGDSVLGFVIAEKLYTLFPDDREGRLTQSRAALVKSQILVQIAKEIGIGPLLLLGHNEIRNGRRGEDNRLEDALEAIIGAVYLDGGLAATRAVVDHVYGDLDHRLRRQMSHHNPKGRLQEYYQASGDPVRIEYKLISTCGPDHQKMFKVIVHLNDRPMGTGMGPSLKKAENAAALMVLNQLTKADNDSAE